MNKRKVMKKIEKLLEIEALLENMMKSHKNGGILRTKILFFCSIYQNLSVSMINFALMTAELEKDGCIILKRSNLDRRCRLVELTEKGRKELDSYLRSMDKALGNTPIEVDKAIDTLSTFLNKIV